LDTHLISIFGEKILPKMFFFLKPFLRNALNILKNFIYYISFGHMYTKYQKFHDKTLLSSDNHLYDNAQ